MQSPVKLWRNQKTLVREIGRSGRIVAWSMIRVPPANFNDQAPYPVVLVEFENHRRIFAQLVDFDQSDLVYGRKVITIIRRVMQPDSDGLIPYGIKVKPVNQ